MKPLKIVWQRLVDKKGRTCTRCGTTQEALERAVAKLKAALAPLGLEPVLESRDIGESMFKKDPSASNRIWIADRPLEDWLGARTGSSPCCSVCGDSECRTVEIGEDVFEAIPEAMIVKAALVAAAQTLSPAGEAAASCCEPAPARSECCAPARADSIRTSHDGARSNETGPRSGKTAAR
jgi:hypothetical protein